MKTIVVIILLTGVIFRIKIFIEVYKVYTIIENINFP